MSKFFNELQKYTTKYANNDAFIIRRKIRQERFKYKNIPRYINYLESFFIDNNIQIGDKILFWGTNCPEYSLALLATFSTNRIAIPIDYKNSAETIEKIALQTQPKAAIISKYFKKEYIPNSIEKIIYIEDLLEQFDQNKIYEPKISTKPKEQDKLSNIAEIVFTSGTTGTPKGVVITQENLLTNIESIKNRLQGLNSERTISILPLSHMFEQIAGLLLPLSMGITIYYLPKINSLRLLEACKEYKPTHLIFVPQMLKMIWDKIELKARQDPNFSKILSKSQYLPKNIRKLIFKDIHKLLGGKVKYIASGGAPLNKNIAQNWYNIGIPIIEGYGATEVTAVATINDVLNPLPGTVGKPLENTNITLTSDNEIIIQSKAISSGYYQNEEKTKNAFTPQGYKTGDIGEFDNKGNLIIKGRDVFKIVLPSGEKVFVEDLENKILANKNVKECCVVGKKQDNGDKIHLYLILKNNDVSTEKIDIKTIIQEINNSLESKQQISSYEIWPHEDFPRTSTLKIDRKKMYEITNNNMDVTKLQINVESSTNYQDIVDILAKLTGLKKDKILDTDTLAGELEIDSLTRTELAAVIEEYLGIEIDDSQINAQTTVKDLKIIINSQNKSEINNINFVEWPYTKFGQLLHNLFLNLILIPLHSQIIKIKYPQQNIPTIQKDSIVIANHPGMLDAVCVLRTMFKQKRTKFFTYSWEQNWQPRDVLTYLLELTLGAMPMYKSGQKLTKALQKGSDLIDKEFNMLFFPQGQMQKVDNPIETPFQPGIGFIAKAIEKPIQIIKIKGYTEIWPNPLKDWINCNLWELRPPKTGTVEVIISDQINIDYKNMTPIQITNYIEEQYKKL